MGELAWAAHFCVMRSCEYVKVPTAEQRQTKQLCIRYIAFIKDGITLNHNSLPWLKAQSQIPSTMWLWSSRKRAWRPQTGCRAQCCTSFTLSTKIKILQNGQSKRSTTKSSSCLRSPPHPFLKIHRTLPGNGQACRSCPLLGDALVQVCEKVPKAEQRQTKQLCIRYIAFIKDGISLNHDSSSLHLDDCVLVTLKRQKNDIKADTVTQWQTSNELPCPVKIWASI